MIYCLKVSFLQFLDEAFLPTNTKTHNQRRESTKQNILSSVGIEPTTNRRAQTIYKPITYILPLGYYALES